MCPLTKQEKVLKSIRNRLIWEISNQKFYGSGLTPATAWQLLPNRAPGRARAEVVVPPLPVQGQGKVLIFEGA